MDTSTQVGIIAILVSVLLWLLDKQWKVLPRGRFWHLRGLPRHERKLLALVTERSLRYGELDRQCPDNDPKNTDEGSKVKAEAFSQLEESQLVQAMGIPVGTFREVAQNLKRLGLIEYGPLAEDIFPNVWTLFITNLGMAAVRSVPQLRAARV